MARHGSTIPAQPTTVPQSVPRVAHSGTPVSAGAGKVVDLMDDGTEDSTSAASTSVPSTSHAQMPGAMAGAGLSKVASDTIETEQLADDFQGVKAVTYPQSKEVEVQMDASGKSLLLHLSYISLKLRSSESGNSESM